MGYKIEEIEGIGPAFAAKLSGAGITNTDHLLEHCGAKSGRGKVAGSTGISEKQILRWTNMADLMRIKGVGEEYSDLLEAAGVDTVKELRNRNAVNLAAKMSEINTAKSLVRSVPSADTVTKWVDHAKTLDPAISH